MHRDRITEMRPPIAIDANHVARLSAISSLTVGSMMDVCEYLRQEFDRAHILPAPSRISRPTNREVQEIILAYPFDAGIARRRVSVLI